MHAWEIAMYMELRTSQAVIILTSCYSFLVLLLLFIVFTSISMNWLHYYERPSWLGKTIG